MKTEELIERFPQLKILVLGDFLLDEFVFGEISRVSREAPVLILRYRDTRLAPGGAANTVANVASLGAQVIPLGFVGRDGVAESLFSAWPSELNTEHVFRDPALRTTRKVRLLAGSFHSFRQQVVRLDYEYPFELQKDQERRLTDALEALVPEVDAIVLSDYSLGNLTAEVTARAIQAASRHGKMIVADSRDHPDSFAGATSITPNITEVEAALSIRVAGDLGQLEELGSRLLKDWQLDSLLVTRGKLGMSLFTGTDTLHIPIHGTDEVVDVSGAGDTVTATYATTLAAGGSFEQAARLANCAAGLAVMKKGTATVTPDELAGATRQGQPGDGPAKG